MEWNDLRDEVGTCTGVYDNPLDLTDQLLDGDALQRDGAARATGCTGSSARTAACTARTRAACKACPAPGAVVQYANGIVDFQQEQLHRLRLLHDRLPVRHPALLEGRQQGLQVHALLRPRRGRARAGLHQVLPDPGPLLRHQGGDEGARRGPRRGPAASAASTRPRSTTRRASAARTSSTCCRTAIPRPTGCRRRPRSRRSSRSGAAAWPGRSASSPCSACSSPAIFHYMRYGPLEVDEDGRKGGAAMKPIGAAPAGGRLVRRYSHGRADHPLGRRDRLRLALPLRARALPPVLLLDERALRRRPVHADAPPVRRRGVRGALLRVRLPARAGQPLDAGRPRAGSAGCSAYMKRGRGRAGEGKYNAGQKLMYWSMVCDHRPAPRHRHHHVAALLRARGPARAPPRHEPPPRRHRLRHVRRHRRPRVRRLLDQGLDPRDDARHGEPQAWARFHHPGWFAQMTGKDAP